jgi:hypothetical protein
MTHVIPTWTTTTTSPAGAESATPRPVGPARRSPRLRRGMRRAAAIAIALLLAAPDVALAEKSLDQMSQQELSTYVAHLNYQANWRKYRRPGDPPDFVPGKPVRVMNGAGAAFAGGGGRRAAFRRSGGRSRSASRRRNRNSSMASSSSRSDRLGGSSRSGSGLNSGSTFGSGSRSSFGSSGSGSSSFGNGFGSGSVFNNQ